MVYVMTSNSELSRWLSCSFPEIDGTIMHPGEKYVTLQMTICLAAEIVV